MSLLKRASLVGISLRSVLNHTLLSKEDRQMRDAIARLRRVASIEIEESRAGRDRALDLLAGER